MQRNGGPSLEGWYQVAAMCLSDALEHELQPYGIVMG